MTLLNHLNLSYKIHAFTWVVILNLCGTPLTTKCPSGLRNAGVEDGEVEDEDGSDELLLYVSMGLGFIVGFWTSCGTLMIKNSSRYAHFKFIDEMRERFCAVIAICMACFQKKVDVERQPSIRGKNTFLNYFKLFYGRFFCFHFITSCFFSVVTEESW